MEMKNFVGGCFDASSVFEEYVPPFADTVLIVPEGVLCSSFEDVENEDFEDGGFVEL